MLPCLTFSIIRYGSRVQWNNPGNEVASFLTPQYLNVVAIEKRSFGSLSIKVANLYEDV